MTFSGCLVKDYRGEDAAVYVSVLTPLICIYLHVCIIIITIIIYYVQLDTYFANVKLNILLALIYNYMYVLNSHIIHSTRNQIVLNAKN